MRKIISSLILISVFLFVNQIVSAQTVIWTEDFESYAADNNLPTTGANEWIQYLIGDDNNPWGMGGNTGERITGLRSLTIYHNNGTAYTYRANRATERVAFYSERIDASIYTNLTLSFNWKCDGQINQDYGRVVWSTDGTTWIDVNTTNYQGQGSVTQSVTDLDISVADNQQFYIGFRWINNNNTRSAPGFVIDDVVIKGTPPATGIVVNPASLDFGSVANGGNSILSYTLLGNPLTPASGNITVTAPTNFEVSLNSGSGFSSSITVPYTGSTLASTLIYVRFSPSAENTNYSGSITNSGGGAITQNVAVSGNSFVYCIANSGNRDEYIGRVQVGTIDNTTDDSDANGGYADYTAQSTDMIKNTGYPITITNGNPWWEGDDQCGIWIDWNQDGDFVDANETITVTGTPGQGPYTANIIPPVTASTGNTRMRIRVSWNTGLTACGTADWGEVEDYTLNVISPATYYSQGADPTQFTNWNTETDGSGSSPLDFSADNQVFIIQAANSMTAPSAWSITGNNNLLQIQNGASLTANAAITLSANSTFQLDNGATYNHNVNNNGIWAGTENIDLGSTVSYGFAGAQDVSTQDYGNLTIAGGNAKTIQGNISIAGTLNLSSGLLSTGSGTNDIIILDGASIAGAFSNTNMIECDGDGSLIKESTNANVADFAMIYPVGTGSLYTPFEITSLTATVAGTGSIQVRAEPTVAPGPPAANATDLQKYWDISQTGLSGVSANLRFTYVNPTEIGTGGDQSKYIPAFYNSGTSAWETLATYSAAGSNPMIASGITELNGQWTAKEEPTITTYYSYQSGAWSTAETWTTDPSGTLSVDRAVPGTDDRIVILNGRTVTTTANNYTVLSVRINEGGTLNLGATTGHDFGTVSGQGLLRLQTENWPGGTWDSFVSADGGTVEYYNTANFNFSQLTYNHLIVNLSTAARVSTLVGNMTLNGDLTVKRGIFQINNTANTSRTISVSGDVDVNTNGSISLGSGNENHRFIVGGNFTNDGSVRFTNQVAPNYTGVPNNGRADVVFNNGTADQQLQCNGLSDFYRIEIDKGIDQTYILNIDANSTGNFELYGKNNYTQSTTPPAITNQNALGLLAGTLRLGPNIVIPSLCSNQVYLIDEDASIWLDGANLTFSEQANTGDGTALILYGTFKVSEGSIVNDNSKQGIISRTTASFIIEGGTINTECVRTSYVAGTHRGAFVMSGGTLTIRGEDLPNLGGMNVYSAFTLPYPDNVLKISGGTINILYPNPSGGGSGSNFSVLFGMNSNNASITGGTFNITIPNDRYCYINSTAPFWNLNITSTSATQRAQIRAYTGNATISAISAQPLVVLNDLAIQNNGYFDLTNPAPDADVTVGHNFTIQSTATYLPGTNTTIFNGVAGQVFTNVGTIGSGGLYDLQIINSSNTSITQNLVVRNDLDINSDCFLQDMGNTISVAGDVTNSGTHTSQASGAVILNGTLDQTIGGDGNGVFGNLIVNKASGTSTITANQSLSGNLRLANNGLLDIGTYKLSLGANSNVYDAVTGTTQVFSTTKMVRSAGNQSDGGITKTFSSINPFIFPLGTANDYTPATIEFTSVPTTWGSVNIKPVTQIQPFTTSLNALNYYWKVVSSEFTGVAASSVSHRYRYVTSDIGGAEANYIPAVYNPYSWTVINNPGAVLDASNDIDFKNVDYIDGDFTAGEIDAFQAVKVFYSRQTGSWNDPNTWSSVSNSGIADGALPGANNPVVIGDGSTNNHIVTVPVGFDNITIGGLQINSKSVLDIGITTGHNMGAIPDTKVLGNGTLRISSAGATAVFPGGDFGNFLSIGGGIVEYYSTATLGAATFNLPTTYISGAATRDITSYNNLVSTPQTGKNIILPDVNFIVYDDFTVNGDGLTQFNTSATTRTLTVDSSLIINTGGTLRYMNASNVAQNLIVNGDITVNTGATFDVNTSGTATNLLSLKGNLTNDGVFDMNTGTNQVCNVTFFGDVNKEINGGGATTDFNTITVNKGSSRNTVLEVKSDVLSLNTSLATALTLSNGTFRLSSLITLDLTNSGSFTIPESGSLSANGGTINIGGAAANNNTDLKLDGRLEVLAGTINIGTGTNFNNDIEYSSGGYPEIIVSGNGTLNVNGQIRRPTTISTGSLNYSQSGNSTVTIAGRQATNSRAMFEVLNTGSAFNMSGGTLNIIGNFNNSSYNDLYLAPESSTVTGGAIVFGNASTPNSQFNAVTSVPLWDMEVDGNTNNKYLNLRIYPLTLQNDLTINGNSEFRANGLDLTIGNSLINNNSNAGSGFSVGGYQAGSKTQTTTFNGTTNSSIVGSGTNLTNFSNLVNASTGILALGANSNIRINKNLTLSSGYIEDNGNEIILIGNIENNAAHISSVSGGGIIFEGTQEQVISGNGLGIFGNVDINNSTSVNMVDNSVINGELNFTNGNIYIDDYLLTFGKNATITGNPNSSKMIILNGVISDAGVKKIFNSGASDFIFPIGVSGKYTPATYSFTTNPNADASITVKPVNYFHPAVSNGSGDELAYYWNVVSSGFSSAYSVDHAYNYLDSDVSGTEGIYLPGRYLVDEWVPLGGIPGPEGEVFALQDSIQISAVPYLDGEYTAGETANFTPNLPTLYSITTGNWFDGTTWSETPGGLACGYSPNGNPVVIEPTHTVTLNNNTAVAYSVEINGTLDAGTTVFHNLGHVSGGGTLKLSSTVDGIFVFPGGEYDVFMQTAGSTLEFFGDNEASLPLKPGNNYKPYQNVVFSGNGKKLISAEDLKILNDLTIQSGTTLSNELFNRTITILGDWTDNNTTANGGFIPGKGTVNFNGSSSQILTVANGATTEQFYNLKVNNSLGMTLAGSGKANVSNLLYLTSGNITTNTTNLLSISNTSSSAVIGGGSASFVNGPLQKRILAGGSFNYPVGDATGTRYGKLTVSEASATGNYIAQYYNYNPLTDGYDPAIKTAPVDVVSSSEYWRVNGPASANANVTVRWDATSGIIPPDATTRAKLRIVEWNTSWVNRGNVVTDGGVSSGTIKTNPIVNLVGDHFFTIGVESLPTATITSSDASICDDGSTTNIEIELTGTAPWTIRYKVDGANETTINNIATSPYDLVISNTMEPLASGGPDDYIFNVSYIQDATGSTGISDFVSTVTITLNESPNPVISGLTTTPASSTVSYSTPDIAGHTYSWTVTGGTKQSGDGTNEISVLWGTGLAGTVQLTETVTIGGCSTTTPVYNVTLTDIPSPLVSGNNVVCSSTGIETETYSTPAVGTHTYVWTVVGGNIDSGQNTNEITVLWSNVLVPTSGSVEVVETGSTPVSNTLSVTVNPLPPVTNVVSDPTVCAGDDASIVITGAPAGIDYQLRLNSDNSLIGAVVNSGPGGDVTITVSPAIAATYNVWASNEYSCGVQLTDLATVIVNPTPTVSITDPAAVCSPNTVDITAAAVTAGSTAGLTYSYWTDAAATLAYATPATAAAGTYYIKGATASGCFDIQPVVVTVNPTPTITLDDPNVQLCQGGTSVDLIYTAVTGTPDLYSINFDGTAELQGFTDVSDVALGASPISITVPGAALNGTYNANLTVTSSGPSCISIVYPITVTVNPIPTANNQTGNVCSDVSGQDALTNIDLSTLEVSINGGGGITYIWYNDAGLSSLIADPTNVVLAKTINGGAFSATEDYYCVVSNGTCTNTATVTYTINRIPETGPQYHLPN